MDDAILITELNDFIFCPISIYFHKMYGNMDKMMYQTSDQLNGTSAHESIDEHNYSSRKDTISSLDVFCEKYNLIGKIDIYIGNKKLLVERKKIIRQVYDGYVFQLYAQYFSMIEMGYEVKKIKLHSIDDNKSYDIKLPEEDPIMFEKFEQTIEKIRMFDIDSFIQTNSEKCKRCIYEPACDRTLLTN
jgi:CRISPR-associated protein Cas4